MGYHANFVNPKSKALSAYSEYDFTPVGRAFYPGNFLLFIGVIASNFVALHQTRERVCKMCGNADWHPDRDRHRNEAIQYIRQLTEPVFARRIAKTSTVFRPCTIEVY